MNTVGFLLRTCSCTPALSTRHELPSLAPFRLPTSLPGQFAILRDLLEAPATSAELSAVLAATYLC
jgi:hypothetical protein